MEPRTEDQLFQDFRRTGDPAALAEVFDRTAPELLRIALHLAGDVARAEDLVQATFVTAIESAATFDPERRVLPWLAGILTNRARELRRKDARAIDADRLARPTGEDPVRHAQDAELRDHLDEAIRTLPEIYRPVLVLHLRHGLDAAAIAGALQRRVGTVRSQLVRGLEMVRKLLPAGLAISALAGISAARGLAAVRSEVLAAAAAAGPVVATTATTAATAAGGVSLAAAGGLLVMKKVVFAALVVALGAACWVAWPGAQEPGAGTRTAAVTHAAAEADPVRAVAASANPDAVAASRTAVDVPTASSRTSLLVRVRWGDDKAPAAGIALTARPRSMKPIGLHDVAAVTSPAGTALLQDVPPGKIQVSLDRGGSGEVTVEQGSRAELVIEVPPGVTVQGTVVRKDDTPVTGARIWISKHQADDEGQLVTTTGDDGTFALRSVQPSRHLSVFAAGYAPSVLAEVKGRVGDTVAMRFVLQQPGRGVHGRVSDPSGAPVSNATVVLGRVFVNGQRGQFPAPPPTWLRTDDRGEFATASVLVGNSVPVHARAPGFAPWKGEVTPQADDSEALEIRLAHGATVSGRVLDTAGQPCAGAWVEAGRFDVQAPHWLADRTTTSADGSFRLAGIASGEIPVGAGRPKERGVRDRVIAVDGQEVQWNPVLSRGLTIAGKVVNERREPLAGWLVGAQPHRDAMGLTQKFGKTDASGHFVVEDCDPGDHILEIGDPASGGICPAFAVDGVAAGSRELLIVVPDAKLPSARITGRVIGVDGKPAVGVPVSVRSGSSRGSSPIKTTGAEREDDAGRFTTQLLPPGKYEVTLNAMTFTPLELGWKSLAPEQTLDLGEIRLQTPGTYLVTARRRDGSPLTTSELCQIVRPDGSVRRAGPMRDGKLGGFPVPPGPYTVRIWDKETFIAERSFEVRSGETAKVEIETSPGFARTVAFQGEPLPANTVIRIEWEDVDRGPIWKDEATAGEAAQFNFTGSIERAFAKGRYRVRAETSLGTKGEGSFAVGGEPGAAATIRVPLR